MIYKIMLSTLTGGLFFIVMCKYVGYNLNIGQQHNRSRALKERKVFYELNIWNK